jgi:beta-xylosidase
VHARVADLIARMTLREKCAQLYGVWVGADAKGAEVAPHQRESLAEPLDLAALIESGLGQLTRPFGTAPVDPALGALSLARTQAAITAAGRLGIPALPHEECLAGFAAWQATIYPVPLAWGASFNPELVGEMGALIGADLRSVGVYQGLAPVLDVMRDPRWGRVEETIGEDPCLVGTVGAAYVRGLQSAGVVATLKHFAGYGASVGARNHAPVRAGGRELADVILPPFEYVIRTAGARSVMHSYNEIDGLPTGADAGLLTDLLRGAWGFEGTVVSDYFAVGFLATQHAIAENEADAAGQALSAGVDVELPTVDCYGDELVAAVERGDVAQEYVDRALWRVLIQKCELGLLDPDWSPVPPALRTAGGYGVGDGVRDGTDGFGAQLPDPAPGTIDLDPPANRALARRIAEESVILLDNRAGLLPLFIGPASGASAAPASAAPASAAPASGPAATILSLAVVGPLADSAAAMLGCYSFPAHVGPQHPGTPVGVEIPTVLEALQAELPAGTTLEAAYGCEVDGPATDPDAFPAAVSAAAHADVCLAVLGDRAGLFGRGTSGEGCDAPDLRLPGVQGELLEALIDTGTPVILVLLTGRGYALGDYADRLAGIVQAFFPGEEGGAAVAGVLTGRVDPSGRLPLSIARDSVGGQPWTYLQPPLGHANQASSIDPTPLYAFGHGLSYTAFSWQDYQDPDASVPADGGFSLALTVRNDGERAGSEVVQLYLHDPVAQTTRPTARLIGYAKVRLEPGCAARVRFSGPAELTAFTGRAGRRVVEPGRIELRLATSSAPDAVRHRARVTLTGPLREIAGLGGGDDAGTPCRIACDVRVEALE